MFAKLARFSTLTHAAARRARSVAVPCNDNQPTRRGFAAPGAMRRPVLVRRWHMTPSGALECRWSIAAEGGDGEEVTQSRRANRRPDRGRSRCRSFDARSASR